MFPTAEDVANFLGKHEEDVSFFLVESHLSTVTAMVYAYVRGRGFSEAGEPADDLAAVIVSSCVRQMSNPEHNQLTVTGPFTIRPGVFDGWTLPELAILHSHRRRTA